MRYKTRKDWRQDKTGAKSVDPLCQNHGKCWYCYRDRNYKNLKRLDAIKFQEDEHQFSRSE